MLGKRCTLRDIALKCDVSTAMVSTVLNGKEGRMHCSEAKRKLIRETAHAMAYHPNILARSIRSSRIPIIGVFFRHWGEDAMIVNDSIRTRLNAVSVALNRNHLEVLFAPYTTTDDQLTRMHELVSRGLIGGIITDIIVEESGKVGTFLGNAGLPYMILGKPADPDIYCVYLSNTLLEKKCLELAGNRICISVEIAAHGQLIFRRMPYTHHYIWSAPKLSLEEVRALGDRAFFAVMGKDLPELMRSAGLSLTHSVLVEQMFLKDHLPLNMDTIFLKEEDGLGTYLEQNFCPWVSKDMKPQMIQCCLDRSKNELVFVPNKKTN